VEGLVVGGKYHVVQLIGQGGMGAVYDAIHAKTGRRVALKLIHERLANSHASRRRFEREARAAAAIESLHVVQILDSGEDAASGMPFLVMEFLQGDDLRVLLRRGPLPERFAIAIALQIASGVKKAHEVDVVHRDLKPANVFLAKTDDSRRVVKVLDFGIAKLTDGGGATTDLTSTSDVVGSPGYMSPEQLRAPSEVDAQTDVWALGVVLYEMLSGRTPTAGVEPIGARVYAICHTPAPPLRTLAPRVSPGVAAIVHRALEIEPSKRFKSMAELSAALRAAAPNSPEIVETDIPQLLSGSHDEPAVFAAAETLRERTMNRGRAWRAWGLAAGAAGLVAAVSVFRTGAFRERPGEAPHADATVAIVSATPPPVVTPESAAAPAATVTASASASGKLAARAAAPLGISSSKRIADAKRPVESPQPRPPARSTDGREEL
jgi:serine/threonine protein kinase